MFLRNFLFSILGIFIYHDITTYYLSSLSSLSTNTLSISANIHSNRNTIPYTFLTLHTNTYNSDSIYHSSPIIHSSISSLPFYTAASPILPNNRKNLPRYNRAVSGRQKNKNSNALGLWKQIKEECDNTIQCRNLPMHTEENCLLQCQAPSCYQAIYAENPLEPGEIDSKRASAYSRCLKELEIKLKKENLWPPIISSDTGLLIENNNNKISSTTTTTTEIKDISEEITNIHNNNNEDILVITDSPYASATPSL